ncbi:unnamed protein product, partial [Symbiodinium natans]
MAAAKLRIAIRKGDTSHHRACASMLWALAKLHDRLPMASLKPVLLDAVKLSAPCMDHQQIVNVAWASAAMHLSKPELEDLFTTVLPRLAHLVPSMNCQDVSNSIWCVAKMRDDLPGLLDLLPQLAARVKAVVREMEGQNISNIVWSAAELRQVSTELFPLINILTERLVEVYTMHNKTVSMMPQVVSNTVWAVAKLKEYVPPPASHVESLAQMAAEMGDVSYTAQQCANVVWAFGKLELSMQAISPLMRKLCERALRIAPEFQSDPQNISNFCWGLANTGWKDAAALDTLTKAMMKAVRGKQGKMVQLELSSLVWAHAKLGVT